MPRPLTSINFYFSSISLSLYIYTPLSARPHGLGPKPAPPPRRLDLIHRRRVSVPEAWAPSPSWPDLGTLLGHGDSNLAILALLVPYLRPVWASTTKKSMKKNICFQDRRICQATIVSILTLSPHETSFGAIWAHLGPRRAVLGTLSGLC